MVPAARQPGDPRGDASGFASPDVDPRPAFPSAQTDALTGLPNRSATRAYLTDQQGTEVSVLHIDLDSFRTVNDSLGHDEGDMTLTRVAALLRDVTAPTDFLARVGGDEFVVVRPDSSPSEATALAAAVLRRFAQERWGSEGHSVQLSCRIGITVGDAADDLLRQAGTALSFARDRGSTRFYSPEMTRSAAERSRLASRFAAGLDAGALELLYQPQCTDTGRLVGAEALVRWNDGGTVLTPGDFIATVEESRLIDRLSDWTLDTVGAQQRRWKDAGLPPTPIAVNLSPRQFSGLEANVAATVAGTLARYGLAPTDLELELTESTVMPNPGEVDPEVEGLIALGVPLALDDFGTGYSALASITRLPISKIKLDRSLISDLSPDARSRVLVEAALWIAARLGIQCVAEGVETVLQRDILVAAGCTIFQGYLFGRPVDAAEFEARWLRSDGTPGGGTH